MTRYERVKTAMAHKTPDRTPSCIHLAGDGQQAYFGRLYERYVTGELREKQRAGLISYANAIYYGMGNHVLPVGCPWWGWKDIPPEYGYEEAPGFLPKTVGYGSYEGFANEVKNLKENTDAYVLVTIWGSHFEKANFARGIENFLADLAADPEFAQDLLDLIIRKNLVMLENIVNIPGIDGILLGSDWGSQRDLLMSPSTWRSMIRPGEEKEYKISTPAAISARSCRIFTRWGSTRSTPFSRNAWTFTSSRTDTATGSRSGAGSAPSAPSRTERRRRCAAKRWTSPAIWDGTGATSRLPRRRSRRTCPSRISAP